MLKPGENFGYRAIIARQTYNTNVARVQASTVYMRKATFFVDSAQQQCFLLSFSGKIAADLGASMRAL
jgi:hypothetical protein